MNDYIRLIGKRLIQLCAMIMFCPPPPLNFVPPSKFLFTQLNFSDKLLINIISLTLRLATFLQNQRFSSSGPSILIHIITSML